MVKVFKKNSTMYMYSYIQSLKRILGQIRLKALDADINDRPDANIAYKFCIEKLSELIAKMEVKNVK